MDFSSSYTDFTALSVCRATVNPRIYKMSMNYNSELNFDNFDNFDWGKKFWIKAILPDDLCCIVMWIALHEIMYKYGTILGILWVYIHCVLVVALSSVLESPFSVSRQRITCLGAMRPCIRQVELQGEFCNTWPVSLSHLCGWRKREKDEEGESKRGSAGQGSGGGGQHKWLGVIGGMSDNEKWLREGARTTAGGAEGRRN